MKKNALKIILILLVSIFSPTSVFAKDAVWSPPPAPGLMGFNGYNDKCVVNRGLAVSITYRASVYKFIDSQPSLSISDGETLNIGDKIKLVFDELKYTDVFWNATAHFNGSPYGQWMDQAELGSATCEAYNILGTDSGKSNYHVTLNVNPPTRSILMTGAAKLSCDSGYVCTVTSPGDLKISFINQETYGKFYWGYTTAYNRRKNCFSGSLWQTDRIQEDSRGNSLYCLTPSASFPAAGQPWGKNQLNIPKQEINFDFNVVGNITTTPPGDEVVTPPTGNQPPTCPIVQKNTATCTAGEPCSFSFLAKDSDSTGVKYGVDWSGLGIAYTWLPNVHIPPSPNPGVTATKTWIQPGIYNIKVIAKDVDGNTSPNCAKYCVEVNPSGTEYIDSGLRIKGKNNESISIAAHKTLLPNANPLRIMTRHGVKSIVTTLDGNDPNATPMQIQTKRGKEFLVKYDPTIPVLGAKCPVTACNWNGKCEAQQGETYANCPSDCPLTVTPPIPTGPVCGNGKCEPPTETSQNCPADCPVTPPPTQTFSNDYDGQCSPPRPVAGEARTIYDKPGTYNINIPPEHDGWEAVIFAAGAGGGGAGGSLNPDECEGGAGSSGACHVEWLKVRSGERISLTVGKGGVGGQAGLAGGSGGLTIVKYSKFPFTTFIGGSAGPGGNSNGGRNVYSWPSSSARAKSSCSFTAADDSSVVIAQNWADTSLYENTFYRPGDFNIGVNPSSEVKFNSNWLKNRRLPNAIGGAGGTVSSGGKGSDGGDGYVIVVFRPCDSLCISRNAIRESAGRI